MGGISGFLMKFPPLPHSLLSLLERTAFKLPVPIEKLVHRVSYSRTGRHLQRYNNRGFRLVVGCIPYRYKTPEEANSIDEAIEVLVINAQNGEGLLFPKGGWEKDESMEEAAVRETIEEAGVIGEIECKLGKWSYKSKRQSIFHEGHMFALLVKQELDQWPEKNIRKRQWVTVSKAREECPHLWMKEALEELVCRQMQWRRKEGVNEPACK
ncbi:Nudix hydrolase 21 [Hibiscus syriacus]|uniref:Nudix hydrolase 21 n=1 Tax=Hibiscus syriacus TaxID=106335 RepID=A0A6A2XYV7_HIBSY|nr:nudix hydrolase 4-like [Hibiscus syriacus]KAE8667766.1 Nudix hydrolase 21 [Hibiscus syriacus]